MVAWAFNRETLMPVVPLVKQRVMLLSDVVPLTAFLLSGDLNLSPEHFKDKKLSPAVIAKALAQVLGAMDALADWNKDAIAALFKQSSEELQLKLRDLLRPFYVAIAGSAASTPLFDSMEILGRDLCRARLRRALEIVQSTPPAPATEVD
jgi:glutamyl-tRNA synthetase